MGSSSLMGSIVCTTGWGFSCSMMNGSVKAVETGETGGWKAPSGAKGENCEGEGEVNGEGVPLRETASSVGKLVIRERIGFSVRTVKEAGGWVEEGVDGEQRAVASPVRVLVIGQRTDFSRSVVEGTGQWRKEGVGDDGYRIIPVIRQFRRRRSILTRTVQRAVKLCERRPEATCLDSGQ
ncbi:hypothetical protein FN846DRAFT_943958 [Sphaerosporella brunnea]|uniref:Uncharacterized protein n=1 Tax=Sphaerosporella brunnea TaxID=1250544 RepID=A0A5J5EZZ8_9PEZI|nr:hypothetical protein FN846DRAFT_943958 [Sphaerosporella brunnea]